MTKVRGVLIDISGTVLVGDSMISGAAAAVQRLTAAGIPVRFLSNTTKQTQRHLEEQLLSLGLIKGGERQGSSSLVITPLGLIRDMLAHRGLQRPLLLLSDEAKEEFATAGQLSPPSPFPPPEPDVPFDAVVVGLAPDKLNYAMLNQAFRAIRERDAPLIAAHKGRYQQAEGGTELGPGAFVAGLEYSTGTVAEVIGKPSPSFFDLAVRSMAIEPAVRGGGGGGGRGRGEEEGGTASQVPAAAGGAAAGGATAGGAAARGLRRGEGVVMIGDDVRSDVIGALAAGIEMGVLVRTGKFREDDEELLANALEASSSSSSSSSSAAAATAEQGPSLGSGSSPAAAFREGGDPEAELEHYEQRMDRSISKLKGLLLQQVDAAEKPLASADDDERRSDSCAARGSVVVRDSIVEAVDWILSRHQC